MSSDVTTDNTARKRAFFWLLFSVVIVGVFLIIKYFVADYYYVPSESMETTIQEGDYTLGLKFTEPELGEVATFTAPDSWDDEAGVTMVKRIIAEPGDTVECCDDDGAILVNGEPLEEPYVAHDLPFEEEVLDCDSDPISNRCFPHVELGTDEYWMMGDNRSNSRDSTTGCRGESDECWGAVNDQQLEAKVTRIIFPLDRWQAF